MAADGASPGNPRAMRTRPRRRASTVIRVGDLFLPRSELGCGARWQWNGTVHVHNSHQRENLPRRRALGQVNCPRSSGAEPGVAVVQRPGRPTPGLLTMAVTGDVGG